MEPEKKFSAKQLVLFLVLVLLIGTAGAYLIFHYTNNKNTTSNSIPTATVTKTVASTPAITASITPSPSVTPTTSATDDWKTYTNDLYGFNFIMKYNPKYNFAVPTEKQGDVTTITFLGKDTTGIGVNQTSVYVMTIELFSADQSLDTLVKDWDVFNSKIEDYTVAGKDARIVIRSGTALGAGNYSQVIFRNGKYTYKILVNNMGEPGAFENDDFKLMLSTFQFTN